MTPEELLVLARKIVNHRPGKVVRLASQKAKPMPGHTDWIRPQLVSVESFVEDAYEGFTLKDTLVVLTLDEAVTLLEAAGLIGPDYAGLVG